MLVVVSLGREKEEDEGGRVEQGGRRCGEKDHGGWTLQRREAKCKRARKGKRASTIREEPTDWQENSSTVPGVKVTTESGAEGRDTTP